MHCPNEHGEMERRLVLESVCFREVDVTFEAEHFVCPVCGLKVNNPALAAANQRALSDSYRKAVGLMTGAEIAEQRQRR